MKFLLPVYLFIGLFLAGFIFGFGTPAPPGLPTGGA